MYRHITTRNILIIMLFNVTNKYLKLKKKIKKKIKKNQARTTPGFLFPTIETETTDDEVYQIYINVDKVSNRTYIQKNELIALCNSRNFKEVAILLDKAELISSFCYLHYSI